MPDHIITFRKGFSVTIDAIQVGVEIPEFVPPGSVIMTGTVSGTLHIIILISSGKSLTAVKCERIKGRS